jgi:chemotaxis protein CheD
VNRLERELPVVYLKPGEMHFTEHPMLVVTVLGSCLSVTMFHRRKRLAGICHGLMPRCHGRNTCKKDCREAFKYVDCSILHLVKLFDQRGVRRSEIEVKCFGAADMFSRKIETTSNVSVGWQNVQTAEDIIRSEGLSIHKKDVGGRMGRKILYYTDTGEVYLKRLNKTNNSDCKE